jgi:hypothetical protein
LEDTPSQLIQNFEHLRDMLNERLNQWERITQVNNRKRNFEFPEHDLMLKLITAYFDWINAYLPVIHRPSFEADLSSGLHLRDDSFASVVLVVCSLGAGYTANDERNHVPGYGPPSSGWKWFNQIDLAHRPMYRFARLHDIQMYCVRTRQPSLYKYVEGEMMSF